MNTKINKVIDQYFTPENVLLLIYLCYTIWMIFWHAAWRDEGQAWLIARDRPNLFNILSNMGYEGTPGLWHSCLYLLSHVLNLPFISMYFFHSAINFAAVYLFVKKTQFHFLTKVLFCSSFLIAFEYNIVARSYVFILLLLFIWALLFKQRTIKPKQYALVLALLAQTSAFGFLLSAVLSVNYLGELCWQMVVFTSRAEKIKYYKKILIPVLLIVLSLIFAYWQMRAPADASFYLPSRGKFGYMDSFKLIFAGFTVITPEILKFNGNDVLANLFFDNHLNLYLGIIILVVAIGLLYTEKFLALLFVEIVLAFVGFSFYAYKYCGMLGFLRHWGILLLVFLSFSMIIQKQLLDHQKRKLLLEILLFVLLFAQSYRSLYYSHQLVEDKYSSGQAVAQYLLEHKLVKERNIAIYPLNTAPAILPYLPKNIRFYFPENDVWGSYTLWTHRWKHNKYMGYTGMITQVEANPILNQQVDYFITNVKIQDPKYKNKVQLLINWSKNYIDEENFYIYKRLR